MTIVRSIAEFASAQGTPVIALKRENVATNVGTVAVTIPSSGSFSTPPSRGYVRVKTVSIVATGTVKVGTITATDGTTTMQVYSGDSAAGAANQRIDEVIEFQTDLALTSVTVNIVAATANSVHDVELVGLQ